jgi:hypothetical protein
MLLLSVILVASELLYQFTLYERDIKEYSTSVYDCMKLDTGVDVVYLGESSNTTYSADDSTRLKISDLVNYYDPKLKLVTINNVAVHSGIYKCWIKQFVNKPKAVIITMNLRSFGAMWVHSNLETQLKRTIRLFDPGPKLLNRFLLSIKNPWDKTEAELDSCLQRQWRTDKLIFPYPFKYNNVKQWDYAMGNGGWVKPDGSWDMPKIALATHYIKAYAFNIKENNPRIADFDEIMLWAKENNVKVFFNLLSENVAYADSLVGKDLVYLMRTNRDLLVSRYTKMGAVVIDNLELVEGKDFIDQNWTTEHYNGRGRMRIAKHIVSKLKI